MTTCNYQFALEIRARDDRVLGQRRIEPAWEPASEWTQFAQWRKSPRDAIPCGSDIVIEPIAHPSGGLPLAAGFRMSLVRRTRVLDTCDFPSTYFDAEARAYSATLVANNQLTEGESFRYRVLAFPREAGKDAPAGATPMFRVSEVVVAPPLQPASLAALAIAAAPFGEQVANDIPVFVPQQILEETSALTEQASGLETGGILIGHLCRDDDVPDIGVRVTAQIPARHAQGERSKLTFTAATWAAVQAAIALRRSDEIMLGWWHSHPARFWCSVECPPERRRACPLMRNFFSEDDAFLHETVFGKAFHVALVVTHTDDGLQHALFGWRHGQIRPRGFHILDPSHPWHQAETTPHIQASHEKSCT